jgi:alpha-1,2-mannosyltransferase
MPDARTEPSAAETAPARRPLPGSVGWLIGTGCLFLFALAIYHAWSDLWVARGVQFRDFQSYVATGQAVLDGQSLYEPGVASLPTIGGTFKYSPFAALLFTALAVLPGVILPVLVLGVNLFALLAAIWTAWRMLGYARDHGTFAATVGVGALSLGLQPVMWNMTWGNINIVLMAIVILDLSRPDGARLKGIGVGLAAAIKLVPGIFIVYLLLTRRFKVAIVSAVTVAGTAAIGFLLLPQQSRLFWTGDIADADRITGTGSADAPENQSIRGLIARFVDDPDLAAMKWMPAAAVIGVLALVVAVLASRRGQEFLAITVIGATSVLVTPLAWSHYWVWLVPVGMIGLHLAWTKRHWWAWAAVIGGYLLLFPWPLATNRDAPFPGLIFVDNEALQSLEAGIGLVLLLVTAIWVIRKPKETAVAAAPTLPPDKG